MFSFVTLMEYENMGDYFHVRSRKKSCSQQHVIFPMIMVKWYRHQTDTGRHVALADIFISVRLDIYCLWDKSASRLGHVMYTHNIFLQNWLDFHRRRVLKLKLYFFWLSEIKIHRTYTEPIQ